ncbi:Hypothetical predicted protein [Mytilus galloprovincialis]|uniref:DED domain-containing protein n=1 Tax=Mytilus galloprovincialis TaxID=29158 RepID=A0A8B6BTQ3_MYTGA|nr:Hypothetical predicted protein [Mytilus galloprovincialis]
MCKLSSELNDEDTSNMKLYLQCQRIARTKKLDNLKYSADVLMFIDRRKLISPHDVTFLMDMFDSDGARNIPPIIKKYQREFSDSLIEHDEEESTTCKTPHDQASLIMEKSSSRAASLNSVSNSTNCNLSIKSSISDEEKLQLKCFCFAIGKKKETTVIDSL